MKIFVTLFLCVFSVSSFASDELIFNSETKTSVLDLYTDPEVESWERYTYDYELCYKSEDIQAAYDSMLSLKDDGVILSDSETDEYVDSKISNGKIFVTTYSSKVADEGEDPESTEEVEPCNF